MRVNLDESDMLNHKSACNDLYQLDEKTTIFNLLI